MLFYLSATRIPVFINDPRFRTHLCAGLQPHLKMKQLRGNFAFHSLLATRVLGIFHQGTDSQLLRFGCHSICVHLRNYAQRCDNRFDVILRFHIHIRYLPSSCWIKFIFCFYVETTFVATPRSPRRASTSTATLNTSGGLLQSLLPISGSRNVSFLRVYFDAV